MLLAVLFCSRIEAETSIIRFDPKCGNTTEFVASWGVEKTTPPQNIDTKELNKIFQMIKQGTVLVDVDGNLYLYSVYKDKPIYGQWVKKF